MIRRALGGIISPTTEELKAIGKQYHFEISDEELDYFSTVIEGFMPAYRKIEALPTPSLPSSILGPPAISPPPTRTRSTPGTGGPPSKARPAASLPARPSPSKTPSPSLASP